MTSVPNKEDNVHIASFGPDLAAGPRESVADVLVRAREQHGQSLRSVSQVLRIRQAYLEALESGEFDKLPGTAYALGFLRTYADYLNLNANNIIDRYKEEAQATERPTELIFPEPVVEGRIPGGAIILISMVMLTVAYGSWFALTNQGRSLADLVPALPDQIQALLKSDPEVPADTPEAVQAEAPIIKAPEATPTPPSVTLAELQTEAVPEVAAEVEPVSQETPEAKIQTQDEAEQAPEQSPPAERIQSAALPQTDSTSDLAPLVYSGPPLDPNPAPALMASTPAGTQAAVMPAPLAEVSETAESQELGTQTEDESNTSRQVANLDRPQPAVKRPETEVVTTVVIPAPPAASQDFANLGERTPQIFGQGNDGSRIILRALQDSWVQIRDRQNALLLTRVLRSGDIFKVPDQAGLTLLTGNAGGIQLEVDGVTIPPLGPVGAVRRQIALDPAILLPGNSQ